MPYVATGMTRDEIVTRVRSMTRDFTNSTFRQDDITNYINEAIDRFKQVIPEMRDLIYLTTGLQKPFSIPDQYQHLLALYCTSRCFAQDERHYQAANLMNEFETKLDELKARIEAGEIVILDDDGIAIDLGDLVIDYVDDIYFLDNNNTIDDDDGLDDIP